MVRRMKDGPVLTCARCKRPVVLLADKYEHFEQMHYVCYHYEYKHDADADADCGDPDCPSGVLPPLAPSRHVEVALDAVVDSLRNPYDEAAWVAERERPSVLVLRRPGAQPVRLVGVDVAAEDVDL